MLPQLALQCMALNAVVLRADSQASPKIQGVQQLNFKEYRSVVTGRPIVNKIMSARTPSLLGSCLVLAQKVPLPAVA
jgi:hypothetical protein